MARGDHVYEHIVVAVEVKVSHGDASQDVDAARQEWPRHLNDRWGVVEEFTLRRDELPIRSSDKRKEG